MTNITTENCAALLDILREKNPLVHCITNYVTANTVANGLLAAGASPVMAVQYGYAQQGQASCNADFRTEGGGYVKADSA